MVAVKKQKLRFQKAAQENVLEMLKNDGQYTIGTEFFKPDVGDRRFAIKTLMSISQEEE